MAGWHFRSLGCALSCWVGGFLLDADHFFDYYANHGPTLDFGKIYACCEAIDFKRVFLFLHSYELLGLFLAFIYVYSLGDVWKALAIGVAAHLAIDQFTNPLKPLGYFLLYRASKGFKKREVIREGAV